jgi:hypothetical protein
MQKESAKPTTGFDDEVERRRELFGVYHCNCTSGLSAALSPWPECRGSRSAP